MHATIHAAVENQFASATEPVPTILAKLIRQGLERHNAIRAVLAEDIFNLQCSNAGEPSNQKSYNGVWKSCQKNAGGKGFGSA